MKTVLYWILRPLLWSFYKIFYRVTYFGMENVSQTGKQVVICNHLCKMDVFLLGSIFNKKVYFLAKKEWFKNKVLGWFIDVLGGIPVNRDKVDLSSFKAGLNVLKQDKKLCIFPEGTRNKENTEIQAFKQGASYFAVKGKCTVLPAVIYERTSIKSRNYVLIGKPIDLSKYYDVKFDQVAQDECTKLIEDAMLSLQEELSLKVEEIKKSKKK